MPTDQRESAERIIPNPVCEVVGTILADFHTHFELDNLFSQNGAPGDPPAGSKAYKCIEWFKRANHAPNVDALVLLGKTLEIFMEVMTRPADDGTDARDANKRLVVEMLAKYGLFYRQGGTIVERSSSPPSEQLRSLIRTRDWESLETEYRRALNSLETDPAAAVTSACAIFESFCKVFIEESRLPMPNKKVVRDLWNLVQKNLGLQPGTLADDDLKRILGGLATVIDGFSALRTHAGSAHGQGKARYKVTPRHARLAVNASHTLVSFLIETWDKPKLQ